MAWARLDDRFHEHRKVVEAGPEAVGVWTMCLTWAHAERRTSPTPGVIPHSVVARFAGSPAKGRRIAGRLAEVGLFDPQSEAGWPIHDYAVYLPKYDTEQAAENGRKGGRPKKNPDQNQTGFQSVSQPEAEPNPAEPPRVDAGASARRNPVPVPSEPNGSGRKRPQRSEVADDPSTQAVVGAWIDRQRRRPHSTVISQVGKQVKSLLAENFTAEQVAAGLSAMDAKSLHPSTLPSLVSAAVNTLAASSSGLPPWELSAADPNRSSKLPPWELR
jgi:hypothetical protein